MSDIIKFFLITVFIGIVSSIPGLLLGLWLARNGVARLERTSIIVVAFCSAFIKQIWFVNLSWWYFGVLVLLATTIGVNRADLAMTFNRGRWWWNSKK